MSQKKKNNANKDFKQLDPLKWDTVETLHKMPLHKMCTPKCRTSHRVSNDTNKSILCDPTISENESTGHRTALASDKQRVFWNCRCVFVLTCDDASVRHMRTVECLNFCLLKRLYRRWLFATRRSHKSARKLQSPGSAYGCHGDNRRDLHMGRCKESLACMRKGPPFQNELIEAKDKQIVCVNGLCYNSWSRV